MTDGDDQAPAPPAPPRRDGVSRRRLLGGAAAMSATGVAAWWLWEGRDGADGTEGTDAAGPPTPPPTTPTTAATTTRQTTTTRPALPTFDVRDHGARGDGRTDDSAALRAAIEAALEESRRLNAGADPHRAARAPVVSIPPGRYLCPGLVEVDLDAPLAFRGTGTAVLDGGPPPAGRVIHHVTPVLRCRSAIDVEGLELERGGVWLSFAALAHDTTLLRVVGCTFRGARAPISSWPGGDAVPHGPDLLVLEDTVVEGIAARDPEVASFGVGLELMRWGAAALRGNRVTGVYEHGLRLGHQARQSRPYRDRPNVVCTGNVVDGVWGAEKSNGIVIAASRIRIEGNQVDHVTSGPDEARGVGDTEGIYVKGEGIEVVGNRLLDGGRLQAQITVKGSDARIEGNRIESTADVFSGGIRVEGTRTEIRANEIIGIREGCDAVSVQANPAPDTIVVADNVIRGGRPDHPVYIARRSAVVVTGNRILGAPAGVGAIVVRTTGQGRIDDVEVRANEVRDAGQTDALLVAASEEGGDVGSVVVADNSFHDVGRAVRALAWDGGSIGSVTLSGNRYDAVASQVEADEQVPVTRTAGG